MLDSQGAERKTFLERPMQSGAVARDALELDVEFLRRAIRPRKPHLARTGIESDSGAEQRPALMRLMCLEPMARDLWRAGTNPINAFLPAKPPGILSLPYLQLQQRPILELPVEESVELLTLLVAIAHMPQISSRERSCSAVNCTPFSA
jgi:hypothetical protein